MPGAWSLPSPLLGAQQATASLGHPYTEGPSCWGACPDTDHHLCGRPSPSDVPSCGCPPRPPLCVLALVRQDLCAACPSPETVRPEASFQPQLAGQPASGLLPSTPVFGRLKGLLCPSPLSSGLTSGFSPCPGVLLVQVPESCNRTEQVPLAQKP